MWRNDMHNTIGKKNHKQKAHLKTPIDIFHKLHNSPLINYRNFIPKKKRKRRIKDWRCKQRLIRERMIVEGLKRQVEIEKKELQQDRQRIMIGQELPMKEGWSKKNVLQKIVGI